MDWKQAEEVLVGGVNSPVRAFRHLGAQPIAVQSTEGAEVIATDGKRYIDYVCGWGPLILGHAHAAVAAAARESVARGEVIGMTHPDEVRLAAMIRDAVASVEQVRFTVSGTEAAMTAIRLARSHTRRDKLLMFDGGYHGHSDSVMVGASEGIPESLAEHTFSVPYNDLKAAERAADTWGGALAAVIVEPVAANMGVMLPAEGFLAGLRELTRRTGALLIFDEVVTGFRLCYGGAQDYFGVVPDLTVFGKIVGGGYPIGAVGGGRAVMRRLAPEGGVYHGGTFAGHPLSMSAGVAALTVLKETQPYKALEKSAQRLCDGIAAAAQRAGVAVQIHCIGSMFTVFFAQEAVSGAQDVNASDRDLFAAWCRALLEKGILAPPSPYEGWFVSTAHSEAQIERTIAEAEKAFQEIAPVKRMGN